MCKFFVFADVQLSQVQLTLIRVFFDTLILYKKLRHNNQLAIYSKIQSRKLLFRHYKVKYFSLKFYIFEVKCVL